MTKTMKVHTPIMKKKSASSKNHTLKSKTFKKKIGSKAEVAHGTAEFTSGHKDASSIKKTKSGRYVFKKSSSNGKSTKWMRSLAEARKVLKMEHKFVLINKGPDGIKLYKLAKEIHSKKK